MYLVAMRETITGALVLSILVNQALHVLGTVTILRGPLNFNERTFICMSEDDGGALVWNYNLNNDILNYTQDKRERTEFTKACITKDELDCKMEMSSECFKLWKSEKWNFTNAFVKPIGPVFDERFEGYRTLKANVKYRIFRTQTGMLGDDNKMITALVFSFRAKESVQIWVKLRDKDLHYYYYKIILGWKNAKSTLQKCQQIHSSNLHSLNFTKCTGELAITHDEVLSEKIWRTFIVKWNPVTCNMSVYDVDNNNKLLLSHIEQNVTRQNENARNYVNVTLIYISEVIIKSAQKMKLTYHGQEYLHTIYPNATLSSPTFRVNNKTICLQLIIGLCMECSMDLVWRHSDTENILTNATIKKLQRTIIPDLPMWRSVKLQINLPEGNYTNVKLQLISKLDSWSFNPLWAVARIRQCSPDECFKKKIITVKQDMVNEKYYWPDVTCQKLFYYEHTVVNSISNVITNDFSNCPHGYIGPKCLISCLNDLKIDETCNETSVCYRKGCAYPPELYEVYYAQCISGEYGHCRGILPCGKCNDKKICNKITGKCEEGCNQSDGFYLPLSCQTGLQKLKPEITFKNKTNIKVSIPVTIKDENEKNGQLYYYFTIINEQDSSLKHKTKISFPTRIFQNMTKLVQDFGNLRSNTTYRIKCILQSPFYRIESDVQTVTTHCDVPSRVLNLIAQPLNDSRILIKWSPPEITYGTIIKYEVILKILKYYGCVDLQIPMPTHKIKLWTNETFIVLSELRPYASFEAQIVAYNACNKNEEAKVMFTTLHSVIPTAKFSNLRLENYTLMWDYPKDCTTITGPIGTAKIEIRGISEAVHNFCIIKQTRYNYLYLDIKKQFYGAERYLAKVYVKRNYQSQENILIYTKIELQIPPGAPPKVTEFDIVEIDYREETTKIHLRWRSLQPPLNGKLHDYRLILYNSNGTHKVIQVLPNEFCDLWDDYICIIIQADYKIIRAFSVQARNVNVTELSPPTETQEIMNAFPILPGPPTNCTATIYNDSVIDLKWHHPWQTKYPILYFYISIDKVSSSRWDNVFENFPQIIRYPVKNYTRYYTKRLYLMSSTQYFLTVKSMTIQDKYSAYACVTIRTPSSIALNGILTFKAHKTDPTILVEIPYFVNKTFTSRLHIVVKGPFPCEFSSTLSPTLLAQAGIDKYDVTWHAANLSVVKSSNKVFTIGDNKKYGGVTNCPLTRGELYEIFFIITERSPSEETITLIRRSSMTINPMSQSYDEMLTWVIPTISFFLAAIGVFYFYRK